ncbi:MAG: xanthine dehydrogenase small subunit [Pseudomonadota bacterium]
MTPRTEIRFVLNDDDISLGRVGAGDTLLDFLRINRRLTGTKEGCAEGDCGACTVLVGRLREGELKYEPVNACIRFLVTLDGCHVVTVEHLSAHGAPLHPVQRALVDHHGAQCGFCTPGIVMALSALWMDNPRPSETDVDVALQGNLCRCTGYEPIVQAAMAASEYGAPSENALVRQRSAMAIRLQALHDQRRVETSDGQSRCILPASVDDLALAYLDAPNATLVAGATDVGLWVTKFLRDISPAIFLGHLEELQTLRVTDTTIEIGAGVSYSEAHPVLCRDYPHLDEFWSRIAGWQVRSMGTLGGNIANGSPIGDTPPIFIALGATITLRKGEERRNLPLEEFFIDYGKQDRATGEFLESISLPRPKQDSLQAAYKISKRRDEDISSTCAAFHVTVKAGKVTDARIAFGGMAGTPKRATSAEKALIGADWSEATVLSAADCLEHDFTPLSDWRASAEYRLKVSKNLFRRFWLECQSDGQPVRLSA